MSVLGSRRYATVAGEPSALQWASRFSEGPVPAPGARHAGTKAHSSQRRAVAKAAIESVLRRLEALPLSPGVEALRERAEQYRRDADLWTPAHPAGEDKEQLMRRVLQLHVEVKSLER